MATLARAGTRFIWEFSREYMCVLEITMVINITSCKLQDYASIQAHVVIVLSKGQLQTIIVMLTSWL